MSYAKCTSAALQVDFNVSDATLAAIADSALSPGANRPGARN
jgi:hypothetical protein